MRDGDDPNGTDTFALLCDEARVAILRVLAAARAEGTAPVGFADLRRRVGMRDSGLELSLERTFDDESRSRHSERPWVRGNDKRIVLALASFHQAKACNHESAVGSCVFGNVYENE